MLLMVGLFAVPSAHGSSTQPSVSVASTNSSANCENNNSLTTSSFTCSLSTTAGSTVVVFLGCLSGPTANCNSPTATDSQGNTYHFVDNVETSCAGITCEEFAFSATASSTGEDTLTMGTAAHAYLGADLYDVSRINATAVKVGFGGSSMNDAPATFIPLTLQANGFVVAGVIANDASAFSAGTGFTLIPGQPCYSCGMNGGWQAGEYQVSGTGGSTSSPFGYSATNDGWAELALSFAPNVGTTSVTCAPAPVGVASASKCTATVMGDSPTGNITWNSNATGKFSKASCALSSGACSVSYTPSAPGPTMITASYGGDSNNPGSTGNYSLSVTKASTTSTISCSPSPVAVGSPSTCTASVSGASPTGTITWASSGVANFSPATTCTLSAGSCAVNYTPSSSTSPVTITAIYGGDGDNTGSTGTFALAVGSSSTVSTTASSLGQSTTSSATEPSASTTSSAGSSSSVSPAYLGIVAIGTVVLLALAFGARSRRGGTDEPVGVRLTRMKC
jgi:hypothetical protein